MKINEVQILEIYKSPSIFLINCWFQRLLFMNEEKS